MSQRPIFREILDLTERYRRQPYYPHESTFADRMGDVGRGLEALFYMALAPTVFLPMALFPLLFILLLVGIVPSNELLIGITILSFVLFIAYVIGRELRVREANRQTYDALIEGIADAAKRGLAEGTEVLPSSSDAPQETPTRRLFGRRPFKTR